LAIAVGKVVVWRHVVCFLALNIAASCGPAPGKPLSDDRREAAEFCALAVLVKGSEDYPDPNDQPKDVRDAAIAEYAKYLGFAAETYPEGNTYEGRKQVRMSVAKMQEEYALAVWDATKTLEICRIHLTK
jgi:hypothetical protein